MPIVTNGVTPGAGHVTINDNLIQGNKAGNLGGGIGLLRFNGADVTNNPTKDALGVPWYRAKIYNNMIVNNISAGYGGGIALFDAVNVDVVFNTIANNDSTSTGELSFGNVPFIEGPIALIDKITTPTPAGIGVQPVSAALLTQIDAGIRGNYTSFTAAPNIINNIIAGNFSRYWANPGTNQIATLTDFGYWDVGVFGSADPAIKLQPKFSILTDPALLPFVETKQLGGTNNITVDPQFVAPFRNTIDAFQGGATLGNFISFSYSPMYLTGDYHLKGSSPAVSKNLADGGTAALAGVDGADVTGMLTSDFDGDSRPIKGGKNPDIGADEHNSKGDINNDGIINLVDVLILLNGVVTNTTDPSWDIHPLQNGQPSGNGTVDLADALLMLQRALGMVIW